MRFPAWAALLAAAPLARTQQVRVSHHEPTCIATWDGDFVDTPSTFNTSVLEETACNSVLRTLQADVEVRIVLSAHDSQTRSRTDIPAPQTTEASTQSLRSTNAAREVGVDLVKDPISIPVTFGSDVEWCFTPFYCDTLEDCAPTLVALGVGILFLLSAIANVVLGCQYRRLLVKHENAAQASTAQATPVTGRRTAHSTPVAVGTVATAPRGRTRSDRSISGDSSDTVGRAERDAEDAVITETAINRPQEDISFGPCIYSYKQKRVYRAVLQNHYEVAIKLVVKQTADAGNSVAAVIAAEDAQEDINDLMREAVVLSRLQHPNVIRTFGVVSWVATPDGCQGFGVATEFCRFGSLKGVLGDPSFSLPLALRLQLARGVAAGMQYLHGKNLMHRDLKSSNILIDGHWQVKVIDFGTYKQSVRKPHAVSQGRHRRGSSRPGREVRQAYSRSPHAAAAAVDRMIAQQADCIDALSAQSTPAATRRGHLANLYNSAPARYGARTHSARSRVESPVSSDARDTDSDTEDLSLTTKMGTLSYLAPELFTDTMDRYHYRSRQAMLSADVYSYGIVLWEIFTRADPWHDERHSKFAIMRKVVAERKRPSWTEPPSWVQTAAPRHRRARTASASIPIPQPNPKTTIDPNDFVSGSLGSLDTSSADELMQKHSSHRNSAPTTAASSADRPKQRMPKVTRSPRSPSTNSLSSSSDQDSFLSSNPMFLAELRKLADNCWHHDPDKRVNFGLVRSELERLTAAFTDDTSGGVPNPAASHRHILACSAPTRLGTRPHARRRNAKTRASSEPRVKSSRQFASRGRPHSDSGSDENRTSSDGEPGRTAVPQLPYASVLTQAPTSSSSATGLSAGAEADVSDLSPLITASHSRKRAPVTTNLSATSEGPASHGTTLPPQSIVKVVNPSSLRICEGVIVGSNDDGSYRVRIFPHTQAEDASRLSFAKPRYFGNIPRSAIKSVVSSGPMLAE